MDNTQAAQAKTSPLKPSDIDQPDTTVTPDGEHIANGSPIAVNPQETATSTAEAPRKVGLFESLSFRGFRFLWFGTLFTSTANWVQQSTLGWVVYDLTGSGSLLGGIQGVRAIPTVMMMPFSGVMTDRMDRRNLMVASQVPLIFLNAGLAFGLLFDRVEIWHLFPFVILSGFAMALNQPARQTAVFDLVPRENVPNAVALNQSAMSVTRALGPSAAAFLLGVFGASGNFFLQAAAYVGVTATTLMIVFPAKQPAKERRSFMRDSADGFKYVAREPLARWLMLMSIIMPLFIIPTLNTLMPVFAKDIYGLGPSGFGFLVMAIGIGNFGGALFTAALGNLERRGLLQLISLFVTGISLFGFAFAPNIYIGVPLLLICGFAEMIFLPTNTTLMQLSVPDHMRGRITSILLLNPLLIPIGSFLVGVGVDGFGGPATVAISAGASTVLGLFVWAASPRLRNLRLSDLKSAREAAT